MRWALLAPLVVLLGVFVAYPLGYSLYLSFTDFTLLKRTGSFVGLDQYAKVLGSARYGDAMVRTGAFVALAVTIELLVGLAIALALHQQRWARNVTRAFLLVPMFIAPVAVGLIFRFLLNQQLGVIPNALGRVGIEVDFLGAGMALPTLALIDAWQWTPFMVLLILAGLEARPQAPLEAARMDGASSWLVFRAVTLRALTPVLVVAVVVRVLEASKLFEYVYVVTGGGPGGATESLQFLMYQTGVRFFRLGEAAAMAFLLLAVLLVPLVLVFRGVRDERRAA